MVVRPNGVVQQPTKPDVPVQVEHDQRMVHRYDSGSSSLDDRADEERDAHKEEIEGGIGEDVVFDVGDHAVPAECDGEEDVEEGLDVDGYADPDA